MNYKERFAGLNANGINKSFVISENEIFRKISEEKEPFNPYIIQGNQQHHLKMDTVFFDNIEFTKTTRTRIYLTNLKDDEYFLTILNNFKTMSEYQTNLKIKIPNQNFGRELLQNLGVI